MSEVCFSVEAEPLNDELTPNCQTGRPFFLHRIESLDMNSANGWHPRFHPRFSQWFQTCASCPTRPAANQLLLLAAERSAPRRRGEKGQNGETQTRHQMQRILEMVFELTHCSIWFSFQFLEKLKHG